MSDGDWVKEASEDKALVVEVLLKLSKESPPPPPPPPPPPRRKRGRPAPPPGWSVRQRRSRSQLPSLPPAASDKKSEAAVASPSTPLSWSGVTSMSGGVGGGCGGVATVDAAESCNPNHNRNSSDVSRSKVTPRSETTPTKRSRKRKSLAKLKAEEMMLIEEQQHLKREIATLRVRFEGHRKENEILKKKVDMVAPRQSDYSKATQKSVANNRQKDPIFLPDLNIPADEV